MSTHDEHEIDVTEEEGREDVFTLRLASNPWISFTFSFIKFGCLNELPLKCQSP